MIVRGVFLALAAVVVGCGENRVRVFGSGQLGPAPQLVVEVPETVAAGATVELPLRLFGPVSDFAYATVVVEFGDDGVRVPRPKPHLPQVGQLMTLAGVDATQPGRLVLGVSLFGAGAPAVTLPGVGESIELGRVRIEAVDGLSPSAWTVRTSESAGRNAAQNPIERLQFSVAVSELVP